MKYGQQGVNKLCGMPQIESAFYPHLYSLNGRYDDKWQQQQEQ